MSVTLHTENGDMKIHLYCQKTPKNSFNFLAHCASGTYTNTKILRSIPKFLVQFGDPTNTGKGGESIWGGFIEDEIREGLKFDGRGKVAMAKMKEGNGSQFFITYGKHGSLDGKYTVIGEVVSGAEEGDDTSTLSKLETLITDKKGRPKTEVLIKDVTVHANPFAENLVRSK